MLNWKVNIVSRLMAACFLYCIFLPFLSHASVTITIGNGSGLPGSQENQVLVSLENPDSAVKGVQVDICDVDDFLSCTGCETTGRASGLSCSMNDEQGNGCVRVLLFSLTGDLIDEGTGPIINLTYEVSADAPEEECRALQPEEVKISDESKSLPPEEITSVSGEFCFGDSTPTTTTTTEPTTTTTAPTTTTTAPTTTTTIFSSYKVYISPLSATLKSGAALQFNASTTYDEEEAEGIYTWQIVPESNIGSTINGDGLFVAGDNTADSDIEEIVKVTDIAHDNVSATATLTIKAREQSPPECAVTISPLSATIAQGDMLLFGASTTGDCDTPQFEWSLTSDTDNSSIEPLGDTCFYTAGVNYSNEPLTDVMVVTDTANDVSAEAEVTVIMPEESVNIKISPDSVWKSHWIPLPRLIFIEGEGTHFNASNTTITFEPPEAVFQLLTIVFNDIFIWDIILVMPGWLAGRENKTVTITVTTGDEAAQGNIEIKSLPLIFESEEKF